MIADDVAMADATDSAKSVMAQAAANATAREIPQARCTQSGSCP